MHVMLILIRIIVFCEPSCLRTVGIPHTKFRPSLAHLYSGTLTAALHDREGSTAIFLRYCNKYIMVVTINMA
jgi:hypothetical protein